MAIDPLTAGLAGGTALLGFFQAKEKEKEARRVEKMNRELGAVDTLYSPFVKGQNHMQAVPDAGPGAFAGALTGGLAGFNQAQAMQKPSGSNVYNDMLDMKSAPLVRGQQIGPASNQMSGWVNQQSPATYGRGWKMS